MAKIFAIVLVVIFFSGGAVIAADNNGKDNNADANSNSASTLNFSTTDNSRTLPQILMPTKLDGSFVAPPQTYYDQRLGESAQEDLLPPIYRLEGWKIFYSDPYKNGVKVKRIKAERKSWISDQESVTGERVNSDSEALGDNEELVALPYYPENAREVAIAKVFLSKEKYIINQAISEAWYHAWDKSLGAKYYVVLYNSRLVSQADVSALGSAMVGAISADRGSVDAISGGGGVGFGTAKSHIFKEPAFMVIALSNKGDIPQRLGLLKKEEPPPIKEEIKEPPKEEYVFPMVDFEFDKFKIATEEQKKSIRQAAKKTAENWDKMKKENMQIFIVGSCSPEGTAKYNDVLGRKRSQEVYNLFAFLLVDAYGIPDSEVKERIKFVSAGKNNYPEFEEFTKQRNAAFFIAAKLKAKKE